MRILVAGLLGCVLASLTIGDARCESDPGIREFVDHWDSRARSIKSLTRDNDAQIAAGCGELTGGAFDFDAMLRDTLPDTWAKLNPIQRKVLAAVIAKKAASDCINHIQDYDDAPFTILGIRIADNGDRLVTANVRSAGGRNVHVTWRLRPVDPNHWKAVDMIIEGHSMTADVRGEFSRILISRNGNLTAAIDIMGRR